MLYLEPPVYRIQHYLHRLTWAHRILFCYQGRVYECPPMRRVS